MPQENHDADRGLSLRDREAQDGNNEWAQGYNHLLAIGISRYDHFKNLPNAVNDVKKVAELLSRRYHYDAQRQTVLLDAEATLGNIHKALRSLQGKVKNTDNLLVYFSGHGFYDEQLEEGFWIPYDGQVNRLETYLDNTRIIRLLRSIHSRHILLVADSCFSGAFFETRNVRVRRRLMTVPSRWALTSGRVELVPDGPPGKNSPFAESFLFHLEHNQKSHLGITSLYPLVLESVGSNSEQLPRCEPMLIPGHSGGEFFFSLEKEGMVGVPQELEPGGSVPQPGGSATGGSTKWMWWAAAALAFALCFTGWQVAFGDKDLKPDNATENEALGENKPDSGIAPDTTKLIGEPIAAPAISTADKWETSPEDPPKKASLVLSFPSGPSGAINLGVMTPGEEKTFLVKVKNKGEGKAENLTWHFDCDSMELSVPQLFNLGPGSEVEKSFQFRAGNAPGPVSVRLEMKGGNLFSVPEAIRLVGIVKEPEPEVVMQRWARTVEEKGIRFSFISEGVVYKSVYDDSTRVIAVDFPDTLLGRTVEFTFVNDTGAVREEQITLDINEKLTIPNFDKPSQR
ncbi:MAG: caspase family protein [Lewinellaceae bacterium]|nr:caspase family protein [Phaeodactylibacter sp.]MCB9041125.1 caspase family protein [Lewinellaceae bacterium]